MVHMNPWNADDYAEADIKKSQETMKKYFGFSEESQDDEQWLLDWAKRTGERERARRRHK